MEEKNNQQISDNALNQDKQDFIKNDVVNNEDNKMDACKKKSTIGLIFGLIPIVLFVFCLIVSGGDSSENGNGSVFWLLIIYGWTLAIPFAIISIVNSVNAIKINKNSLSITSLVISLIPALAIVILLIIMFAPRTIKKYLPNTDTNYIIHSRSNPNISISFPTIGERKLECGDDKDIVYCNNDFINIEGINRVGSYIEEANSLYDMYVSKEINIYNSFEKIDCIDNAICYVGDIYDTFSYKDEITLSIFAKAAENDDYFKINYTFDKSKREEYINKILKETHITYE